MPAKCVNFGIFLCFKRIINVIKLLLLMFLIAYTSLHISNRTVLLLLGTLDGYILRFPQKQHGFYLNVPVKWVFWTLCLRDNLPDPSFQEVCKKGSGRVLEGFYKGPWRVLEGSGKGTGRVQEGFGPIRL